MSSLGGQIKEAAVSTGLDKEVTLGVREPRDGDISPCDAQGKLALSVSLSLCLSLSVSLSLSSVSVSLLITSLARTSCYNVRQVFD